MAMASIGSDSGPRAQGWPTAAAALAAAGATSAILGLPAVMPDVMEAFRISHAQGGLMVTSPWIGHAVSQALAAWAAGAMGVRRLLRWTLAGLGALLILSLLAPSYPVLVGLRTVTGFGVGAAFVLAVLYAAEHADAVTLRSRQGLVGAAAYAGCAVSYAAIAGIQGSAGWRVGYVPSLAFIVGSLALLASPRSDRLGRAQTRARLPIRQTWSVVWSGRIPVLAMAHLSSFGVFVVVASWLTTYFLQWSGLGRAESLYVSAGVLTAGAIGRFVGGALLGRVPDRALIMEALACSAAALAGLALSPPFPLALTLACVVLACSSLLYGSIVTLALGRRPPAEAGVSVAWMLFLGSLGGAGLPTAVGWLVDGTGSFAPGFALLAGITFATVTLLPFYPQTAPVPDQVPTAVDGLAVPAAR